MQSRILKSLISITLSVMLVIAFLPTDNFIAPSEAQAASYKKKTQYKRKKSTARKPAPKKKSTAKKTAAKKGAPPKSTTKKNTAKKAPPKKSAKNKQNSNKGVSGFLRNFKQSISKRFKTSKNERSKGNQKEKVSKTHKKLDKVTKRVTNRPNLETLEKKYPLLGRRGNMNNEQLDAIMNPSLSRAERKRIFPPDKWKKQLPPGYYK